MPEPSMDDRCRRCRALFGEHMHWDCPDGAGYFATREADLEIALKRVTETGCNCEYETDTHETWCHVAIAKAALEEP